MLGWPCACMQPGCCWLRVVHPRCLRSGCVWFPYRAEYSLPKCIRPIDKTRPVTVRFPCAVIARLSLKQKKKGGGEASKATTITKPEGRRSGFFMYAPGKWTNPKWEFAGARSSFAGGPVEFCRWPIEIFCQPGLVLPGGRSSFAVARSGFGRGPVEFCRRSVKFCKRHACTCS